MRLMQTFYTLHFPNIHKNFGKRSRKNFLGMWNFPNCLGAVDGKHCVRLSPKNSGTLYHNYKKTYSTNIMAIAGADYRFIMVDVGSYGSCSDSGVFYNTQFAKDWTNNSEQLHVPKMKLLPETNNSCPHVLVGDAAFGLKMNILTPYSGKNLNLKKRIFNYRLSRARRVVENAFGILAHTWRLLLNKIEVNVEDGNNIILCCCILHNIIKMSLIELEKKIEELKLDDSVICNPVDDLQQPKLKDFPASAGYDIRAKFSNWMINKGALHYQNKMVEFDEDYIENNDCIYLN